jgi:hypothetical protein
MTDWEHGDDAARESQGFRRLVSFALQPYHRARRDRGGTVAGCHVFIHMCIVATHASGDVSLRPNFLAGFSPGANEVLATYPVCRWSNLIPSRHWGAREFRTISRPPVAIRHHDGCRGTLRAGLPGQRALRLWRCRGPWSSVPMTVRHRPPRAATTAREPGFALACPVPSPNLVRSRDIDVAHPVHLERPDESGQSRSRSRNPPGWS